jgi:hypothetical protein
MCHQFVRDLNRETAIQATLDVDVRKFFGFAIGVSRQL